MAADINIVVLFGGRSGEHEVSRSSAAYVIDTLKKCEEYRILPVGITREGRWYAYSGSTEAMRQDTWLDEGPVHPASLVPDTAKHYLFVSREGQTVSYPVDLVFPVLHGPNGEDGTIQGMLELAGLPFVGCGMASSALAMDKIFANSLFEQNGIAQTPWLPVDQAEWRDHPDRVLTRLKEKLSFPIFVKPARGGSSLGITKVTEEAGLSAAIETAFSHDRKVLAEEGVRGRELEIAALGAYGVPFLSPVGEIIPDRDFYDYESKYESQSSSQLIIPADLDEETVRTVHAMARAAWRTLDCYGMARIDFFLSEDGRVLLNEINTIPGFVSISMYPRLMRAVGLGDEHLMRRLVDLALERDKRDTR